MDSREPPKNKQEERVTIAFTKSTRNAMLARLITVIGLTAFLSYHFISDSAKQYDRAQTLTIETYLEKFEDRKADLLEKGRYSRNKPLAVTAMFIAMGFLIGSYELIVFAIGLLIGKFIRP